MTPDQLIEYQKNSDNGTRFDILDLMQTYIGGLDWRASGKKSHYAALRSFFLHNRAELPRDGYVIKSEKAPVNGTLSAKEIRDMVLSSNKTYQAIFLSMFQAGLDLEGFIYWNSHGLEETKQQLKNPDIDLLKINLPGRKKLRNVKPFYTFIGGDAIDALRVYMKMRPAGGDHIFYTNHGEPIRKNAVRLYWIRHLDKIGLIERHVGEGVNARALRYGKNLHEMRDVRSSQWEKSPAKYSICEFTMGHRVDANDYNKAHRDEDWVRGEYLNALPMLQLMSSERPYGLIKMTARNQAFLEQFVKAMDDSDNWETFMETIRGIRDKK